MAPSPKSKCIIKELKIDKKGEGGLGRLVSRGRLGTDSRKESEVVGTSDGKKPIWIGYRK